MPEEKVIISIVKNQGTPTQEITDIRTDGYLLLYIAGEKIKTSGDIELRALAPLLAKLALEKLSRVS